MKKTYLIIGTIMAVIFLSLAIFVVSAIGTSDVSQKFDYFKNAFSNEPEFYPKTPSDEVLKELFKKEKASFALLVKMSYADKVNSIQKHYIFHRDKNLTVTLYPYSVGEFPGDKFIPRERFLDYMSRMKNCHVACLTHVDKGEAEISQIRGESGSAPSNGYLFDTYHNYEPQDENDPSGNWVTSEKNIYYLEEDNVKTDENTDEMPNLRPGEVFSSYVKLEPHWYIRKQISVEKPEKETEN